MDESINDQEHMGLVYRVAQDLANNDEICIRAFGRDVSEYLGEGYLALQKAKKNYNPSLGFKFSTYACKVIRDRLVQFARRSTLIKVSYQARYQASRAIQGKEVKPEDAKKIKDALKVIYGNVLPITDYMDSGRKDESPEWESLEELNTRLDELDPRTRDILIMRFGLDGNDPLTLEEVGLQLDPPLTRERVRQIEKMGVTKLREVLNI